MKRKISTILSLAVTLLVFSQSPLNAAGESCIECHLHQTIVSDAAKHEEKTLAAFHIKEFDKVDSTLSCRECHGENQSKGQLPKGDVCLSCHTKGKTTQGNPKDDFHAEKNHWPMKKVSCPNCHKAHVAGNHDIKFLTPDVIGMCGTCHKKTFGAVASNAE